MALVVTTLDDQAGRGQWVADRRLYLTADRSRVVEAGNPEARFLLVATGKSIPFDQAEALGLIPKPSKPKPEPEPVVEPRPDLKEKAQPEDKELEKPEDKSRFKRRKKK